MTTPARHHAVAMQQVAFEDICSAASTATVRRPATTCIRSTGN
ncbi:MULTISPECIES: hypothetical protein [unclassified Stenotrophomonas]|nr:MULTISPECIES: hypothetical protein [unclassified Stenotrophomonas]